MAKRPSNLLSIDDLPLFEGKETDPIELRKAHEAIFLKPTQGSRLSFVMRKAYNVLLKNAQEMGIDKEEYRISVTDMINHLEYDSHDYELLKNYLRKLQGTQVEWDTLGDDGKPDWGVTTLLSRIGIKAGMITYTFESKIKSNLLDPKFYSRIDLRLQNQFRSSFSLILYETCGRYSTNPSGVTARLHWTKWRSLLCGEETKLYDEFKYFNARVLKKAITEVNLVSDIEVEPIVTKEGRQVTDLQFKVKRKKQEAAKINALNESNSECYKKMLDLGLKEKQAKETLTKYEESLIISTLEMIEKRRGNSGMSEVKSIPAYFLHALEKGYAPALSSSSKVSPSKKDDVKSGLDKIRNEFINHQSKESRNQFLQLDETLQQVELNSFLSENPDMAKMFKAKGLDHKPLFSALVGWYGKKIFGEPTDSDILNFALQNGFISTALIS